MSVVILFFMLVVYFIPSIIAYNNKHHNALPILLLNLFLGFLLVPWVIALVWSVMKQPTMKVVGKEGASLD